jgi:asparagine synthase (glutamine-hydrolysing)
VTVLIALSGGVADREDDQIRHLLRSALHGEPSSVALIRPAPGTVMGVAAPTWDLAADHCIASDGRYTVVAHAAIYYRKTLDDALRAAGGSPLDDNANAATAILAAIRRWGWEGVLRLEGDFAFIAWDSQERALFAARDHAGSRSLFHSPVGDGIVVASTLRMTRAVPGVVGGWNIVALAEDVADIDLAVCEETAFSAIRRVPAGFSLEWHPGGRARVGRWWDIPVFDTDSGIPFEDAALELRRIVADAVVERADLRRGCSVMLSGGYDSSAIYGAGSWGLVGAGGRSPLRSLSLSHPPGDPGREDELIEATTAQWGGSPTFIPSEGIPAIEPSLPRARVRDEPFCHTYELWNRALARGCREQGSRIALNGNGGDAWFSTSPAFLADLLRQGRLVEFRREWGLLFGRWDWYKAFKVAVQPNLPPWALYGLKVLRGGRPIRDREAREIPDWVAEPLRSSDLLRARRTLRPARRSGETVSAAERAWFLHAPFPERVHALCFSICQAEGVELRAPLLDARVVRFAASRPRWECNSNRQNKHLLRKAIAGVVPDVVSAPRPSRTGLPSTYLRRSLRAHLDEAQASLSGGTILAQLGVVDHRKLMIEITGFLDGKWSDDERAVALIAAVHGEWWLRTVVE